MFSKSESFYKESLLGSQLSGKLINLIKNIAISKENIK